jgi:hypothetical protein
VGWGVGAENAFPARLHAILRRAQTELRVH